jgi:polyphosphate glucokinase
MAHVKESTPGRIFAVDIGATNIKYCHVDASGDLLDAVRRRLTPYPCSPSRLVDVLSERIAKSQSARVGVGFPGEFVDGHVVRPGNLSRPGGVLTAVDPQLDMKWRGFALQDALIDATGCDVRVVNDATLAALGSCEGVGRELVFTLGTGFGLALVVDGSPRKVRDVGAEPFVDSRTYDQVLGERARANGEAVWRELVVRAITGFVDEFDATVVHLAGGNARRWTPETFVDLACPVEINGNQAPLHGAAKLF